MDSNPAADPAIIVAIKGLKGFASY